MISTYPSICETLSLKLDIYSKASFTFSIFWYSFQSIEGESDGKIDALTLIYILYGYFRRKLSFQSWPLLHIILQNCWFSCWIRVYQITNSSDQEKIVFNVVCILKLAVLTKESYAYVLRARLSFLTICGIFWSNYINRSIRDFKFVQLMLYTFKNYIKAK